MERLKASLCILPLLLLLPPMHAVSYNFWDSATANVELPNHFLIDEEQQAIIVAAK